MGKLEVQWERKMKALARPSFPLWQHRLLEGHHLPLVHMVATSSHLRALPPPRRANALAQTPRLA